MAFGRVNPQFRLENQGINGLGNVFYNFVEAALIEAALKKGEGKLGNGGAFLVSTGKFTGRSPKDKHVVKTESVADTIWWENNAPMAPGAFEALRADMLAHMQGCDYFVQDLYAGADPIHRVDLRMVTELAWHGLFIRHLLRRPERAELDDFAPEWTVINCPSFKADPARHGCRSETVIALNFDRKLILIANTAYAGENKKAVFTLLNYLLTDTGVMPMHCSANHAIGNPVDTAVFFGLSGTGKTTLARLIAQNADAQFIALSAVMAGVKDVRAAVEQAQAHRATKGRRTVLFLDEVHRFSKSQQDTFLPYLEDGTLIFIGATTENPSFELVSALLSRARVYVLRALPPAELEILLQRALADPERGLGSLELSIDPAALSVLAAAADGALPRQCAWLWRVLHRELCRRVRAFRRRGRSL